MEIVYIFFLIILFIYYDFLNNILLFFIHKNYTFKFNKNIVSLFKYIRLNYLI